MPPKAASKAASTGVKKVASKASSKASSKSGSKTKEVSDKTKKENARYQSAVDAMTEKEYVSDVDVLNAKSTHDKLAQNLTTLILAKLDSMNKSDKCQTIYTSDKYILLDDKLNNKTSTRSVKTKGGKNEPPKKKRLPRVKGQKNEPQPESETDNEVPESETADDETNHDQDEDKSAESADTEEKETDQSETKTKAVTKKNVTQINRNGKTWLGFIVNRFVFELYSSANKSLKNEGEFVNLALNVTKDFTSHISRSIVPTVERLGETVTDLNDFGTSSTLDKVVKDVYDDAGKSYLTSYTVKYLTTYFKLLANVIAQQLWCVPRGVNGQVIEVAMRLLDMGNDVYLVQHDVCKPDDNNYGLLHGVLFEAREYDRALNPPLSDDEKKERAEKRKSSKGKPKKKESETVDQEEQEEQEEQEDDEEQDDEEKEEVEETEEEEETKEPVKEPVKETSKKPVRPVEPASNKLVPKKK